MAQVITFEDYTPVARYDNTPWTQAQIEEGATATGTFTVIDTIDLDPVDADPSKPAARNFTTELASDTLNLWYRVVFLDATGDDTLPTAAVQNGAITAYITVDELKANLHITSNARQAALQRCIDAAAYEINQEINGTTALDAMQLQVAAEVNLERAVEHWQQGQSPFGILGLGGEIGPAYVSTDTWKRHAEKLSFLKQSWGIA